MRELPVLELGGTHVTAARVDTATWRVLPGTGVRRTVDPGASADVLVAALVDAASAIRPGEGTVWGVAVPGPFDYPRGVADFRGVGKFDALRGLDLGDVLRRALTGGTGSIHFVNDAEAFAIGEWAAGAAYGHSRSIGVTLGTGVGSAFLVEGVAQSRGPGIPPQGRLDLLAVAGHPLEDTVSRRAIRSRYAALRAGRAAGADAAADRAGRLDVRDIATLAESGDETARRALDEPLRALGRVLAPRALAFGASILVVGGSIALAWDVVVGPSSTGMSEAAPGWQDRIAITPARRIGEAALVGAAWHAINRQSAGAPE